MSFGERAVYATAALTVLAAATLLLESLPRSARTIEGQAQLAQAEPGPVLGWVSAVLGWLGIVIMILVVLSGLRYAHIVTEEVSES